LREELLHGHTTKVGPGVEHGSGRDTVHGWQLAARGGPGAALVTAEVEGLGATAPGVLGGVDADTKVGNAVLDPETAADGPRKTVSPLEWRLTIECLTVLDEQSRDSLSAEVRCGGSGVLQEGSEGGGKRTRCDGGQGEGSWGGSNCLWVCDNLSWLVGVVASEQKGGINGVSIGCGGINATTLHGEPQLGVQQLCGSLHTSEWR
jgi:hypothetical protein